MQGTFLENTLVQVGDHIIVNNATQTEAEIISIIEKDGEVQFQLFNGEREIILPSKFCKVLTL